MRASDTGRRSRGGGDNQGERAESVDCVCAGRSFGGRGVKTEGGRRGMMRRGGKGGGGEGREGRREEERKEGGEGREGGTEEKNREGFLENGRVYVLWWYMCD